MVSNNVSLMVSESNNTTSRSVVVGNIRNNDSERALLVRFYGTWGGAILEIVIRETRNDTFSSIGPEWTYKDDGAVIIPNLPYSTELAVRLSNVSGSTSINVRVSA